ncbi:MAG: hypothetical protein FWF53_06860 [Candidatus Azobacteroides sp.]|nr:hypothetical protein [Candidatus Azobacteroides sp.]
MKDFIGVVGALVMTIEALARQNDPQYKVTPVGFLQMLLENSATAQVANLEQLKSGLDREIKVRYMQRGLESEVQRRDDCETPISPEWKESNIGEPMYAKMGIMISDGDMRKYQEAASKGVGIGSPGATVMAGLYETILVKLSGLIQAVNSDLLSAQTGRWGVNAVTGSNSAQVINFGNTPQMNDGIVKLILDYQANEAVGNPQIVGNGTVTAYDILQGLKKSYDASGFSANPLNVYNDYASASKWGVNNFGVFVPGLIAFVDYNKNVGPWSGVKGNSLFFTLPIPMILAGGKLGKLVLDCQLKYYDCPIFDPDTDVKVGDRGYGITFGKYYGLWNAPDDMFAPGDRLNGFNGSLHYIGAAI